LSWPGLAFAASTRPWSVRTSLILPGCTTSTFACETITLTGTMASASKGSEAKRCGVVAKAGGTVSNVYPSDAALATISVAMWPEAPGRFSTTRG